MQALLPSLLSGRLKALLARSHVSTSESGNDVDQIQGRAAVLKHYSFMDLLAVFYIPRCCHEL